MEMEGLRVRILRDDASAAAAARHRYGRFGGLALPACEVCRKPLDLVFDFDLRDPQLEGLGVHGTERLLVLSCLGCDLAYAGQLYYRVSGSTVEVLANQATTAFDSPWPTALPPCALQLVPIPPEERPSAYASEDEWRAAVEFSDPPKHQLGGVPLWVQDELDVRCILCRKRMRLLGQVASETWPVGDGDRLAGHMFGDMGMIYIHYCDACGVLATGGSCY